MITDKSLTIETIINSTPAELWKLITDPEEMKNWYFNIPEFKPVVGASFTFKGTGKGEEFVHKCVVKDVVPLLRITYSWAYENYPGKSELSIILSSWTKKRTRVTVNHKGIDSFPQDHPDFARKSFENGWNHLLNESLKPYAEGSKTLA